MMTKDGVKYVDLTPEEVSARQAEEATAEAEKTAEEEAETQIATDKISGNQKLLDLGLSQAEVDALTLKPVAKKLSYYLDQDNKWQVK